MNYREDFIEYLSNQKKISIEDARKRLEKSESKFQGGYGGQEYRHLCEKFHDAIEVIYGDTLNDDLVELYQYEAPLSFLRMLSYRIPTFQEMEPLIYILQNKCVSNQSGCIALLDYGCGLAPRTIPLTLYLTECGVVTKLYLMELQKEPHISFLEFLCGKYGIDYSLNYINENEKLDYIELADVLEHLRNPLDIITSLTKQLNKDGIIGTTLVPAISNELTHIFTDAWAIINKFKELKYDRIGNLGALTLLRRISE